MEKLNKKRLAEFLKSPKFKKTALALGIIFYLLAFVIAFNPKPFLNFGYLGVFIFSLFGPGMILVPALVGKLNFLLLAFTVALGMSFNDSVSWLVGRSGDILVKRTKRIEKIEKILNKYGAYALFFWSLIPFPYDLIGLIAGYLELPYKKFVISTFLGKFVRFVLLGLGILKFIN